METQRKEKPKQQVTLCFFIKEDQILLAMKKRGFGSGWWNGYGGKPEPGMEETIEDIAIRETEQETDGTIIKKEDLEKTAVIDFFFPHKPAWDQTVHTFLVRRWSGEPKESEEMRPQWFRINDIPYDCMWPGDQHWLPLVLSGKKITGTVYFLPDGGVQTFSFQEHETLPASA